MSPLVLDAGGEPLHLGLVHFQPLLGVVRPGQEGDQVERRQTRLPPRRHEDERRLGRAVLLDRLKGEKGETLSSRTEVQPVAI